MQPGQSTAGLVQYFSYRKGRVMRKSWFKAALPVWLFAAALAACAGKPRLEEPRRLPPLERLQINDEMKARIDLSTRRLLSDEPFTVRLLTEDFLRRKDYTRRFEEWEGDVSGRWVKAVSLAARLRGERYGRLDEVVDSLLANQSPAGYFGVDREGEGWEGWGQQIWGNNRLLLGLVEYYRLTGEPEVLSAARRLGNYLAGSVVRWDFGRVDEPWWNNYTSVIESLTSLYEIVPDREYLEAADRIARSLPGYGRYHSHSFLSALVGLTRLYHLTGRRRYLDHVEEIYWEHLEPALLPGRDVPEWYPVSPRDEGCSIADWVRLNLALWRATGRAVYLDSAELTLWNALFYNQTPNGFFGHNVLTPWGFAGKISESWWCCTMHGLGCLVDVVSAMYAAGDGDIWVNFFFPSSARLNSGGSTVTLDQGTPYPRDGITRLIVRTARPVDFNLKIRIPSWVDSLVVLVDGEPVESEPVDNYLSIRRTWFGTVRVELRLPLRLRLVTREGLDLGPVLRRQGWPFVGRSWGDAPDLGLVGLMYGPLCLSAADRLKPGESLFLGVDGAGRPGLKPVRLAVNEFSCGGLGFSARLGSGRRFRRVDLRPLSAWTGEWVYREKIMNFVQDGEKPITREPVRVLFPARVRMEKR